MMVAAVSARLMVENHREHFMERQKEKQYMRSRLDDQGVSCLRENDVRTNLSRKQFGYGYLLPLKPEAVPSGQNINAALLFE